MFSTSGAMLDTSCSGNAEGLIENNWERLHFCHSAFDGLSSRRVSYFLSFCFFYKIIDFRALPPCGSLTDLFIMMRHTCTHTHTQLTLRNNRICGQFGSSLESCDVARNLIVAATFQFSMQEKTLHAHLNSDLSI